MGTRWPSRKAFSKGACSSAALGILAFLQVARQQRLVLFHQLVDQLAVGVGDGIEIGIAAIVLQHLDHVLAAMCGQIEQQAFLAEALADLAHQPGQVDVVGVDLVDHDHARQAARLRRAHHALGGEFDAGLGVDDDDRGFDAGQGGDRLPGKIRIARACRSGGYARLRRRNSPAPN
jgi:hypothetical protein